MSKIDRDRMSRALVEAGNALQKAGSEETKHDAALELLKLRLAYCTGHEDYVRNAHLADVCAVLDSDSVVKLIEWTWSAYLGGLQHMKDVAS